MSQNISDRNANSHDESGDEPDLSASENETIGATGLTNEECSRYEQVKAEINAMILLEEEKRKEKSESTKRNSDDDDLWLLPL